MSALNDNKTFLSGVITAQSLDFNESIFTNSVFGIWVSVFQHVNFSENGYSDFQPLVRDISAADFAITGKRFSLINFDGKYPNAKFFITSGERGDTELETTSLLVDISDSFVSGYKPLVIMPDVEFAGNIYRRTEITGERNSIAQNYKTLALSGEDWEQTSIPVNLGDGTLEYAYFDNGYSGFSNEVATRYKFLYDDSSKSINKKVSSFEIPIQIEPGANFKYKISRKSDPLGTFYSPDITPDGKIEIDYSLYKDDVLKPVEAGIEYNFSTLSRLSFPLGVFEDMDDDQIVIRPVNDDSITGLKLWKTIDENQQPVYNFYLLATGNYDGIYKATVNIDRYNSTDKKDVVGYALTGIKTGEAASDIVIDLAINDGVYPRVVQTTKYQSSDILSLANLEELIINEEAAQELASDVNYEDENNLAKNIQENVKKNIDLLNELLKDEPSQGGGEASDDITRRDIDDVEKSFLDAQNQSQIIEKVALPKFTLPKETVDRNYYNNYLNSGEQYVAVPLSNYTSPLNYVFYGDQYGQLGYYIEETEKSAYRLVINSTSNGVYISNTSVCKGDTAIYASMPYSDDVYFENGLCTAIPENGIISKNNYVTQDNWLDAVNYFYVKNYLYSVDIFPLNSEEEIRKTISNAISKANSTIGSCSKDFTKENANAKPIIYLEREIYTEPYDQDQTSLFNNTLNSGSFASASGELTNQSIEKLYCVQVFDTEFAENNNSYFNVANDYQETITFKSFAPYKDSNGTTIVNYGVGENFAGEDFGQVYYNDKDRGEYLYRLEFVTGLAFSYNATINFRAWNGIAGQQITIVNQDEKNYGYHLYAYNTTTSTLNFVKSNVLNGENSEGVNGLTNVVVLKFNKQGFTDNNYVFTDSNNIVYTAINTSVLDSDGQLLDSTKVFFNIQKYSYLSSISTQNRFWFTNKQIPINDDSYGAEDRYGLFAPRFFEDAAEEEKFNAEKLLGFPSGPSTSKNYEGSKITLDNLSSFSQGIFNNKLIIKEESEKRTKKSCEIDNDFILNFISRGRLTKEEGLSGETNFRNSRRLKITRVRYNIYSKNLLLIGDAGFPYALDLNTGWEYKLQYKKKSESIWKEMSSTSAFNSEEIGTISSFLNPYFFKTQDLTIPNYLPMVGFLTNISSFLDDSQYDFRIFKYEKFDSPSNSVDIIRKTNFLPIQTNWTNDGLSTYYNIYQVDSGNNLKLIKTEVNSESSYSYAIPSVKQQYFDLGLANFPINGSGYYDIVVSGALPRIQEGSVSANSTFIGNPVIGNSTSDPSSDDPSGPIEVNVIQQTNNAVGYNTIGGVSYSPLINFNNPESKSVDFNIDANYSGYYFVSNGKNATLTNNIYNEFECYVANTGSAATIYNGNSTYSLNNNKVGKIIYPSITTNDSIVNLPSAQVQVVGNDHYIYVKENLNYNPEDFPGIDQSLLTSLSTIVNDSNSSITVTYGSQSISIPANTTYKLLFNNGWDTSTFNPTITLESSYDNLSTQTSYISSSDGLVNLNYDSLILENKDYQDLPIYNFAKNELSVNNDLLNLEVDSFYLLNGNPSTTITKNKKEYFDSIKIYLDGSEDNNSNIFVFKDDTDIDISYFNQNISLDKTQDYYFIKDNSIQRSLNIKIKNGNNEYLVPKNSLDFKLTVSKSIKDSISQIEYKLLFPSSDFSTLISDQKEQLIVIKSQNNHIIDLGYIEASLKSNSFVYFVNASNSNVDFQRDFRSVETLSEGEIARISLETFSRTARILKIKNAKSHFAFAINQEDHLSEASGINILNLKFCDSEIILPSVSDFNNKETFIISKNRYKPNKIDTNKVEVSSNGAISSDSLFQQNSIVSKIYKNSASSTYPSVDKIEMALDNYFREANTPTSEIYQIFYIKDNDLNQFSIRDYFSRTNYYYGKVLLQSNREFSINSYDENNISNTNTTAQGCSFDFDFDLGEVIDGCLTIKNKEDDYQIINSNSEDDGVQNIDSLLSNQFCVNFSYGEVHINDPAFSFVKNRVAFINTIDNSIVLHPIYNKKEFFIASNAQQEVRQYYTNYNPENGQLLYDSFFFEINHFTDVDSIFLPRINEYSSTKKYIIENLSSKSFQVKIIEDNSTLLTISPNQNKTFYVDNNTWADADYTDADGILPEDKNPLVIKYENQYSELESDHVFKDSWPNALTIQSVEQSLFEAFSFNGETEQTSINLNGQIYQFIDCDSAENNSTVNDSSDSIFCYGRGGTKKITETDFVVNDFYLYLKYENSFISKNNVGGRFLSNIANAGVNNHFYKIIERKDFDLLNVFISNARSLRSATAIPFYHELQTYYLPNLSIKVTKIDSETQDPALGELWLGKKFVFINLTKVNQQAQNKIYNYTDDTYTEIKEISESDAVVIFEVVFSGGSYLWQKQTTDLPKVKNVYATLRNVKGITSTGSSNITNGNEFVYLSNFNVFNVSIDSFTDFKLNNFYLYNSCNYPISVLFNNKGFNGIPATSSFIKVKYDGSFNTEPLLNNAKTNFVETDELIVSSKNNADVNEGIKTRLSTLYPSVTQGVYAKANYKIESNGAAGKTEYSVIQSALFQTLETENGVQWSKVDLDDYLEDNYCDLDITKLDSYNPDSRLFVYGSSVRNQFNQAFDTYKLRLLQPFGRSNSFFIFNNTVNDLDILLPGMENYPIKLYKNRLAQIYKNSNKEVTFKTLEIHQRGRYYISNKKKNINYIHAEESDLFIDSLSEFNMESATPEFNNGIIDSLLTLLPKNFNYTRCFYNSYGESASTLNYSNTRGEPVDNFSVIPFENEIDFSWLADKDSRISQPKQLIKPFLSINSAGHYLFNNADYSIKISPVANDIFLVNNCSKNIKVIEGESDYLLYRNTVCVVNSASKRYLKKGKSKDAFYSVFNPKTIINTQREISLIYEIPRHQEILPIYDLDFLDIPSYLKLYSRYGNVQSVYLDFENYFLGKDIPSDCPENMVAYEVGTGHETISKFIFFDPFTNYYTLPGIKEGVEYLVDFDEGLFLNLQINKTNQDSFGSVRYMGKVYKNGETFIGAASSWYEIDCPDYIKVNKITREIPLGYEEFYKPETDSDITDSDLVELDKNLQVPDDPLALFKSIIFDNISSTLAVAPSVQAALCWIPEDQNAFWLDSNFVKDIWEVQEITDSDTKKITLGNKELSFIKCKFKKLGSRFLINSFFFNFYSALQEKLKMTDTKQISMGFDYNLTPNQKDKINKIGQIIYSQQDYILSKKEFLIADLPKNYLIPDSNSSASVIKNADLEVSITIEKLKSMPELRIEDYSSDPVVTFLNNKA